ncbi:lactosylceramide 4-alpha-galactosyltransferase-like [Cucurbita maxima]|uniref:Lactosylceramide 4-alpha-galactosyltransferase-like n=1 Tax=Cucurbita maxima TaxID=3661 RepID=A0A6J1KJE1_CUCMA|nr:lactosylceramide 4-alpha-galactosyltransferase-like [Cucurbita maxima]
MIANFRPSFFLLLLLRRLQPLKESAYYHFLSSLTASFLSLLLLFLLAFNGLHVFFTYSPSPEKTIPHSPPFSPDKRCSNLSSSVPASTHVLFSIEQKHPPVIFKSNSSVFHNPHVKIRADDSAELAAKRVGKYKRRLRSLRLESRENEFSARIEEFLAANSCKLRFFMIWISPLNSFSDREFWAIQSIFKAHENGNPCLVIVSNSLDSTKGKQILSPFSEKGFPLIVISPDFDSIFRNTEAEPWFNQLRQGIIKPGEISLAQNLSNLLRLALLYNFGGIYLDADVIILKNFTNLRNVIGAQTIDLKTGNWSRLNNAVMIFDKNHPLLLQFIQEFTTTFDGNKWGHNGPYLVSRVVSRLNQNPGFNLTVLPPSAFYPVVWSRIRALFQSPKDAVHLKWVKAKLKHIESQSLALHLWNSHSRKFQVEKGSIVDIIVTMKS